MRLRPHLAVVVLALLCSSCGSVYYGVMETFGKEKRHILTDRVEKGRDDQEAAKKQFADAYEQFKAATGFKGGKLEDVYRKLKRELDRSETRASAVHDSIRSIERVAGDLFKEWRREAGEIQNLDLRRRSQQKLADTELRYAALIAAMRRSAKKMEPVLQAFRDHVLYLKHNLNAQAIASLQGQVSAIGGDVAALIRDMEAAIREANAFIKSTEGQ